MSTKDTSDPDYKPNNKHSVVCTQFKALMQTEIKDYQEQLEKRKEYFDRLTGYDVYDVLIERDFQKRFFQSWAKHEKEEFCNKCRDNNGCGLESKGL